MQIRDAKIADLPAIIEIYNQSIPSRIATADIELVTIANKQSWYDRHSAQRPLWVAEDNSAIIGWLSFQDFYGRPAYRHTAELSIYIATPHHRQGIGSRLLARAIARSPELKLTTLLAFVFSHNQSSLKLLEKYGFQPWGQLPNIAVLDSLERSLTILGLRIH